MKIRQQGPMSSLVSHEDYTHSIGGTRQRQKSEDWTKEEFGGQGHGIQSSFNKTRTMMAQHATSISHARHSSHIRSVPSLSPSSSHSPLSSSHESSDDSITVMMQRARRGVDPFRDVDSRFNSACRPLTPPRSTPSSPLKMSWNPDQTSSVTTPERSHHYHGDHSHSLGICGDVVLPDVPISPKGRETSGASNFSEVNSMSGSVESLGGIPTWKSVEELSSLADGNGNNEGTRSRGVSEES
jgi:hypothetical protein